MLPKNIILKSHVAKYSFSSSKPNKGNLQLTVSYPLTDDGGKIRVACHYQLFYYLQYILFY